MDYNEACEATVSKSEARAEMRKHVADAAELETLWAEFVGEFGDADDYLGGDVLGFLGY